MNPSESCEVRWIAADGARHATADPLAAEAPSGLVLETLCGRRVAKDIGLYARLWEDCPQCALTMPPAAR